MKKIKILIFNVGYLTGIKGSFEDYATLFHRYIRRTNKSKRKMILSLYDLLEQEKPDVVFFMEVHSSRDFGRLAKGYAAYSMDNKYKEAGLLSKVPFFKRNCNVVFAGRRARIKRLYLQSGRKRLLYEVKVGGVTIVLGHFALGKKARNRQFKELAEIVKKENKKGNQKLLIGGDFNIRGGLSDLVWLAEELDMKIIPGELTFPTHRPKFLLDLFLASRNVKVLNFRALTDVSISDHLPVVLEVGV